MSRGEQESKKSREEKKPTKPSGKKPSGGELNDSELDGVAGGLAEQSFKAANEQGEKRAS